MEFEIINAIRKRYPRYIGDDCAVLDCANEKLLLTTDEVVESIHFNFKYFSLEDIGYKAASSATSDIAAMGGKVHGILVSLSIPVDTNKTEIMRLFDGIELFCQPPSIEILGGNITNSEQGLHIAITAIGSVIKPIFRSGAREGDEIWITGALGGSLAGLSVLKNPSLGIELTKLEYDLITIRHRKPTSRLLAGEMLGSLSIHSLIDLSDGFQADLNHILDDSKVGAEIKLEKLLLFPGVEKISNSLKISPYIFAATSGEEYELIFTTQAGQGEEIAKKLLNELDIPTTMVGHVTADQIKTSLFGELIDPKELAGWEHI